MIPPRALRPVLVIQWSVQPSACGGYLSLVNRVVGCIRVRCSFDLFEECFGSSPQPRRTHQLIFRGGNRCQPLQTVGDVGLVSNLS